jgi:hypothetical protein
MFGIALVYPKFPKQGDNTSRETAIQGVGMAANLTHCDLA